MTRKEDLRDVTIALVSTSALLLTILAATHFSAGVQGSIAVSNAAIALGGLYFTIGLGIIMLIMVVASSGDPWKSHICKLVFYLSCITFAIGMGSIYWVIFYSIPHP